jgi:hypothetical protein
MTQIEAVRKVMEENGGYATLNYLYTHVLKVPGVKWETKTPYASIRRIVQNEQYFFKIKPGLWALKSYKDKLPKEVLSLMEISKNPKKEENINHSYYQGVLVEWGNILGFETYVPPQDKNKKYLEKPLIEYVNLKEVYNFTYDSIIRTIKTIDVIWFNSRKFPEYVFEVEHTTNFQNSLIKFLELQDFSVKMNIVAPKQRKEEFKDKLSKFAFKPIEERIQFISYDNLHNWLQKLNRLRPNNWLLNNKPI